jgi:hypothetical protein
MGGFVRYQMADVPKGALLPALTVLVRWAVDEGSNEQARVSATHTGRIADQFRQPFLRRSPHSGISTGRRSFAEISSYCRSSVTSSSSSNRFIVRRSGTDQLARAVLGQLLPDDRKIEWASTLPDAVRPLVGAIAPPANTSNPTSGNDRLERARELFEEMQREYTAGNFALR